jgi:hypothetical protein
MANVYRPEFDPAERRRALARRARIGRELGAEPVGLGRWELPPREAA